MPILVMSVIHLPCKTKRDHETLLQKEEEYLCGDVYLNGFGIYENRNSFAIKFAQVNSLFKSRLYVSLKVEGRESF